MAERIPSPGLPEASPRGVPAPYLSPKGIPDEATGGDAGPIARQVADVAQGFFRAEREKVVTAQTMQAEAEIENEINGQILEFRKLNGADAGPRSGEFIEKIGKAREKALEDIDDPDVKRLATMRTAGAITMANKHIGEWTAKQNEVAAENGFKALSSARLNAVAINALDPIARQREMDQMQGPLLAEGRRLGLSGSPSDPESPLGAFTHEWKAQAAHVVMQQAAATRNGALAQQTFASVREMLDPKERAHYDEVILKIGAAEQGEVIARDITKRSMGADGQVDRRKAQALLDALPPSPSKDEAQHRVDHKASIFDAAWKDEATTLAAKVMTESLDPVTGERSLALVDPDDMTALEQKWNMKAAELKKAVSIDQAKARYGSAVEHFFGGQDNWENTARMTPNEFLTDSTLISLPAKHRTALIGRYQALQKRLNFAPSESLVVEEAKKALGIGDKKIGQLDTKKQEAFADLFDAVKEDVRQWSIAHQGQHPDREAERKMIRENLRVTATHWFSPDERQFQQRKQGTQAPQTDASSMAIPLPPAAPSGFAGWRYSTDRKFRYPADAQGTRLGPDEKSP